MASVCVLVSNLSSVTPSFRILTGHFPFDIAARPVVVSSLSIKELCNRRVSI
jgi:hypothetical protein